MTGISDVTIEIFINESEDYYLKNNFVGVFLETKYFAL